MGHNRSVHEIKLWIIDAIPFAWIKNTKKDRWKCPPLGRLTGLWSMLIALMSTEDTTRQRDPRRWALNVFQKKKNGVCPGKSLGCTRNDCTSTSHGPPTSKIFCLDRARLILGPCWDMSAWIRVLGTPQSHQPQASTWPSAVSLWLTHQDWPKWTQKRLNPLSLIHLSAQEPHSTN